MSRIISIFTIMVVLGACTLKSIKHSFEKLTPYERYVKNLEAAHLQERPMVKEWISEGVRSMHDSVFVSLPFSETGNFISHQPEARSYRFDASDGQVLTVNGGTSTTGNAKIFLEIFTWKDNSWKHEVSTDSSLTISHEFTRNSKCLVRIQPELLVNAYYTISISLTPILINPVSGASNKSIQSFYGDRRDGGKRSHEGVDIFAKKGTPVVAPTDGTVSRVGYSKLGGKVVWMYDRIRGHSYYFAHLDSQYVRGGEEVKKGTILGVVGNTGNARFTPPHLHFGIYQSGSRDPLHYIKTLESLAETAPLDTTFKITPYKIASATCELRTGPSAGSAVVIKLEKENYVRVIAQSREWFRISLPDKVQGFVRKTGIIPVKEGKIISLKKETALFHEAKEEGTVMNRIKKDAAVEMLANYKQFGFIRTRDGMSGWILLNTL